MYEAIYKDRTMTGMSVLIMHHLEPEWELEYQKRGTSFENEIERFRKYLSEHDYDSVILTRFQDDHINEFEYDPIRSYVDAVYNYSYGWCERDRDTSPHLMWCDGGVHSRCVLVSDWIQDLCDDYVYISGAFDGACLDDLVIALNHVNARISRVNSLIL